jgi:glycolate oxidase iron-sulfur subunit
VPELELVDAPEAELCCGSAGIYNLVQPEAAAELGIRKAANLRSARPDLIVTANPGCLLQIRRHLNSGSEPEIPLLHPVQVLDASIRDVPPPSR